MGISTYGWGSGAVTTLGFGAEIGYIPELIAESLSGRYAYTCVVTRDYLEVKTRDEDAILLRLKPDSITPRMWDVLLDRSKTEISLRLKPDFIPSNVLGGLKSRDKDEVLLRLKPDSITPRIWDMLLDRSKADVDVRSGGWPWISDPCIDVD